MGLKLLKRNFFNKKIIAFHYRMKGIQSFEKMKNFHQKLSQTEM